VVQVALALVLLAGTALMVRTLERLHAVDLGFEPTGFLEMEVRLASPTRGDSESFYPGLLERIRALPEVTAAGAVSRAARATDNLQIEGGAPRVPQRRWSVRDVLPGYFEAAGIRLIAGRLPTPADQKQNARILVASETAARLLVGDGPAIGRSVIVDSRQPIPREIVGVVADVRRTGPRAAAAPELYALRTKGDNSSLALSLTVRPSHPTLNLPVTLRTLAGGLGPKILVPTIRTAEEAFADTITADRQRTLLLAVVGLLSMALALTGIVATTAYTVARRTREIGVRMAIGAGQAQVVREIVRDAAWPIAVGLALGLGGALLSTRAIASFLFETTPHDPLGLATATVVLGFAALIAAWVPARRAALVDPITTLRSE
jgi:predicted permease